MTPEMVRLACLVVPLFPLAARLRSEPALRDEAVVLCEGNGTAAHVVAATRKARKAGIRPGFTLSKQVGEIVRDTPGLRLVVLAKHGLVVWGDSAEEAYHATIEAINTA